MGMVIVWGVAFALVIIGLFSLALAGVDRAASRRKDQRSDLNRIRTDSDDRVPFDILLHDNHHAPHPGCDSSHSGASHGANDTSHGSDYSSEFGHH